MYLLPLRCFANYPTPHSCYVFISLVTVNLFSAVLTSQPISPSVPWSESCCVYPTMCLWLVVAYPVLSRVSCISCTSLRSYLYLRLLFIIVQSLGLPFSPVLLIVVVRVVLTLLVVFPLDLLWIVQPCLQCRWYSWLVSVSPEAHGCPYSIHISVRTGSPVLSSFSHYQLLLSQRYVCYSHRMFIFPCLNVDDIVDSCQYHRMFMVTRIPSISCMYVSGPNLVQLQPLSVLAVVVLRALFPSDVYIYPLVLSATPPVTQTGRPWLPGSFGSLG